MNEHLKSLNEDLQKWVDFYGPKSAAWGSLRDALMAGEDANACLDAFLRAETGVTARTLEKVLNVITKYMARRCELSLLGKDVKAPAQPSWLNRNGVLPDGYEVAQLWGELRAACHSSDSLERKRERVDGLLTVMAWHRGTTSSDVYREALIAVGVEMRKYAKAYLGEDIPL